MRLLVTVAVAAALVACKKPEAPARPQGQAAPQGAAPGAAAPASQVMRGKVLEKLDAPPYSYLKLKTDSGETWAAVPAADVKVDEEVGVTNSFPMQNFESKSLNRKFDVVYFGTLDGGHGPGDGHDHGPQAGAPAGMGGPMGGGAMGAGAPQLPPGMTMGTQHKTAAAGPSDVKVEKVAKAQGADARTVAEVYAQKASLGDKPVTIRAKVVKFSPGIMGRNWIHLRDGTGTAEKADHDLTVTTSEDTEVGQVVTIKGVVRTDKDFGSGYAYPVIVEDAKISK
jgi:hypothetical protein